MVTCSSIPPLQVERMKHTGLMHMHIERKAVGDSEEGHWCFRTLILAAVCD